MSQKGFASDGSKMGVRYKKPTDPNIKAGPIGLLGVC